MSIVLLLSGGIIGFLIRNIIACQECLEKDSALYYKDRVIESKEETIRKQCRSMEEKDEIIMNQMEEINLFNKEKQESESTSEAGEEPEMVNNYWNLITR